MVLIVGILITLLVCVDVDVNLLGGGKYVGSAVGARTIFAGPVVL